MVSQKRILVIDDNEDDYFIVKRFIDITFETVYLDGCGNIVRAISELLPDCILLDYNLSSCTGIDILQQIKQNDAISNIAVIMMTNEAKPGTIVDCMKNDASNYLIKDSINKEILNLAISKAIKDTELKLKIISQQKEIIELSQRDDLTGLLNRRHFQTKMQDEVSRCKRSEHYFTYALLDLDYFKNINDSFGHTHGDNALRIVANTIAEGIRAVDFACRYGGDEFIIVLNEFMHTISPKSLSEHLFKLEQIRIRIGDNVNRYLDQINASLPEEEIKLNHTFKVSASMGVTYFREDFTKYEKLLHAADMCLYFVKEKGRNALAYTNLNGEIRIFNDIARFDL